MQLMHLLPQMQLMHLLPQMQGLAERLHLYSVQSTVKRLSGARGRLQPTLESI
jgi:hypothetical protein